MARDNKIRMPSSSAGITQYNEESITKFKLDPKIIVGAIILFILIEIAFHANIF